jgi:WD40 repeat protein
MCFRAVLIALVFASIDFGQGKETHTFTIDGELTCITLDPTDTSSMIGFATGGICVFGTVSEKSIYFHPFPGHAKAVSAAAFLPDGKTLATASLDGSIKYWDVPTCRKYQKAMSDSNGAAKVANPIPKSTIQSAHTGGTTALAVRADGHQLLSGGSDGTVKVWEIKTGKVVLTISAAHPGGVKAVFYRHDSDEIITAGADKLVKVWDVKKGTLLRKSDPLRTAIAALAVSANGKKFAIGSGTAKKSGIIKVFDAASMKEEATMEGHQDVVTCLVFHPKSPHLASGSADKMIRIWDLEKRESISSTENAEPLRAVAVQPDGTRFAAISATRLRWWDGFGASK